MEVVDVAVLLDMAALLEDDGVHDSAMDALSFLSRSLSSRWSGEIWRRGKARWMDGDAIGERGGFMAVQRGEARATWRSDVHVQRGPSRSVISLRKKTVKG